MTVLPNNVEAFLRSIVKREQPISARDVAALLSLHVNTVKRIPPDRLPFFRATARGDRRYLISDVLAYIKAGWAHRCECSECRCPYPSKPGTERGGRMICWRCKNGRHSNNGR